MSKKEIEAIKYEIIKELINAETDNDYYNITVIVDAFRSDIENN